MMLLRQSKLCGGNGIACCKYGVWKLISSHPTQFDEYIATVFRQDFQTVMIPEESRLRMKG